MPNVRSRKDFKVGDDWIGVCVFDDGTVNVAATGNISVKDFARLAASVLCEYNTKCGAWQGFPNCNDLVDLSDLSDCVDAEDNPHCAGCGYQLSAQGSGWACGNCGKCVGRFVSHSIAADADETHCDYCGDRMTRGNLAYCAADNEDGEIYCSVGCGEAAHSKAKLDDDPLSVNPDPRYSDDQPGYVKVPDCPRCGSPLNGLDRVDSEGEG